MDAPSQFAVVPQGAFRFCRYSVAALAWLAFALKLKLLLWVVFAILALSALLTIRRAPLVMLYTWTFGRLFSSPGERLNVSAMRFAHTLGSVLVLVCLLFLHVLDERVGWGLTLCFCVIKTISAIGLCPAYKLYGCATSGTCCAFMKKE